MYPEIAKVILNVAASFRTPLTTFTTRVRPQQDPRYEAMMGQPGTTPLDMFKLRVDDLQERLHEDKKLVREVFKEKNFEVQSTTTADQFMSQLMGDERLAKINPLSMKFIFESLLERALRHEKERAEREKRHKERAERHFNELLAYKQDK